MRGRQATPPAGDGRHPAGDAVRASGSAEGVAAGRLRGRKRTGSLTDGRRAGTAPRLRGDLQGAGWSIPPRQSRRETGTLGAGPRSDGSGVPGPPVRRRAAQEIMHAGPRRRGGRAGTAGSPACSRPPAVRLGRKEHIPNLVGTVGGPAPDGVVFGRRPGLRRSRVLAPGAESLRQTSEVPAIIPVTARSSAPGPVCQMRPASRPSGSQTNSVAPCGMCLRGAGDPGLRGADSQELNTF